MKYKLLNYTKNYKFFNSDSICIDYILKRYKDKNKFQYNWFYMLYDKCFINDKYSLYDKNDNSLDMYDISINAGYYFNSHKSMDTMVYTFCIKFFAFASIIFNNMIKDINNVNAVLMGFKYKYSTIYNNIILDFADLYLSDLYVDKDNSKYNMSNYVKLLESKKEINNFSNILLRKMCSNFIKNNVMFIINNDLVYVMDNNKDVIDIVNNLDDECKLSDIINKNISVIEIYRNYRYKKAYIEIKV